MKPSQILLTVFAFALGGGLVFAVLNREGDGGDDSAKLAAAEKRIADLEAKLAALPAPRPAPSTPSALDDRSPRPPIASVLGSGGGGESDDDAPRSPEEQIAKLLDSPEARNLIKGFAGVMTARADRWVGAEVGKYKDTLGLSDGQVERITTRMTAMIQENTAKFQAELDDGTRTTQEIMESQGDVWQQNEEEIAEMLKEELTPDQYAQFEREQLVERVGRVQRRADRELEAIDEKVELDESQEDQVYSILVREAPEYDPAMEIEGVEATLPAEATAEDVSKEDAIRSVLTPEQLENYNAGVESGDFNPRQRGGPWGGGFR